MTNNPLKLYPFIIFLILPLALLFVSTATHVEAGQKIVLFDQGHGQRFVVEQKGPLDLSELSLLIQKEGRAQVVVNNDVITEEKLANVNALIISGAFKPFSPQEIGAITDFIRKGGRLSVMLHIGYPVASLLKEMNVFVSNGVVHEQENIIKQKETDYYVATSGSHKLVAGIKLFKVFGGWALMSQNKESAEIAKTSVLAWADLNRNNEHDANEKPQSFSLAIAGRLGKGQFVIFGDDAIFQNKFLSGENSLLGINLAKWLIEGKTFQPPERALM